MNIHGLKNKIKREREKKHPNEKRITMWRNCIKKLREEKKKKKR